MRNKVVFVEAYFSPIGKDIMVDVPTGKQEKTGLFGGMKDVTKKEMRFKQNGWSDCHVDGKRLSEDIASAVDELNRDGYEVVSMESFTSGSWRTQGIVPGGFGYGFSYTSGVTIVAKEM